MSSERAALARSLLARKTKASPKAGPLPVAKPGRPAQIKQPNYAQYSHIHPEVLQHVNQYLEEFKKGLGNGR